MIAVRCLVLLLIVMVSGPSVASLLCDWACAAKHQAGPASAGGCHEHGTDAAMPTMARGHQCHEVSAPPESVLTGTSQLSGVLAAANPSLTAEAFALLGDRSEANLHGPPHAPPSVRTPLRI
jgi:hypothetical protein